MADIQQTASVFSTYLPYLVTLVSSVGTGWISYKIAIRNSRKSEFETLVDANVKLRDELKKELATSNARIEELATIIKLKERDIEQLKQVLTGVQSELAQKEITASNLAQEIVDRDIKIGELEVKINALSENR